MILDDHGSLTVNSTRGDELPHRPENLALRQEIHEVVPVAKRPGEFRMEPVNVRPLPTDDSWFETTWSDWKNGRVFQ